MSGKRMRRRTLVLATAAGRPVAGWFSPGRAADKSLWILDGAVHVDLRRFVPAAFERRVGGFLQTRLRSA